MAGDSIADPAPTVKTRLRCPAALALGSMVWNVGTLSTSIKKEALRLQSAREQLTQHAQRLAERRAASERLFENGLVTFDTVLTTRRDEVAARLDVLEARSTVAGAVVDLAAAVDDGAP
jgi:outer membrane protein TolC